ncbi:MAG: hypothetical protein HLUCCA11_21515 [Phormidesmis priestleyi Ana]|uniref:Uncharacterized protein n=1 Tax=Phormidesmis priestleyi Ana TaxID=1666911 RepID=A0A0P8BFA2_9CYAN|nr:MAG: hypothetical protein HLUCCA11_21515 [Phormidesmis priestleyi Ana]
MVEGQRNTTIRFLRLTVAASVAVSLSHLLFYTCRNISRHTPQRQIAKQQIPDALAISK